MTNRGSTIIVSVMKPETEVVLLERDHISQIVNMHYL